MFEQARNLLPANLFSWPLFTDEEEEAKPQVETWRRAFNSYDLNGDGVLDLNEFRRVIEKCLDSTLSETQLERLFARIDKEGKGSIDYETFHNFMESPVRTGAIEETFKEAVSVKAEEEENASIDSQILEELSNAVSDDVEPSVTSYKKVFKFFDKDGNGSLNKAELRIAIEGAVQTKLTRAQLDRLFIRADKNKSGAIEYSDFEELMNETIPKSR
mmetsp:Transcript_16259/g.18412  ORF Transcript_16259/g.18412 Transcript_16259/m.18412 type:complete len:216 (+) Transcript_16259:126-773(+)